MRAAKDAYMSGAKRLEHDDLTGAEHEFNRALQLDPGNTDYVIAISVARQHRLSELVQQASKARLTGEVARAETLLAQAREIDPADPMVVEHALPTLAQNAARETGRNPVEQPIPPLTDRGRLLAAANVGDPGKMELSTLAGPLQIHPTPGLKSFHLRGDVQTVLREVARSYGVGAVMDDSVGRKDLRFDLENVDYKQAMSILMSMDHDFAVPLDETSVLIAKDNAVERALLERMLEETIYLPGLTDAQVAEVGNIIRTIFNVTHAIVAPNSRSIIVRAPGDVLGPMNRSIQDLVDAGGQVMLDVKLVAVDTTRMRNIGATIPTQAGIYSVAGEAAKLVNANQTLVQQAIAQGFVSPTASNIEIALALIGSGLVQSSLLSSTVGFFGGGLSQTGITSSTNVSFSLGLNSSDSRALDDVQMQVADREAATFRAGTRYPIVTSTYTAGVSTPASSLGNATVNGVSVASLLSQFAGGAGTTVPQVTYEDLGVTLKATPVMQKSGRINLTLDMKIEALAGGALNGNPILASRQFSSDITVADGESAVLISNMNRTESAAVVGIPGLSELPGFQAPINQNAEKDSGQLVVLVTPHVVRRRSDVVASPRFVVRTLDGSGN